MENGQMDFSGFVGKNVALICEDKGCPYPRKKEGILLSVNDTHFILRSLGSEMAILRSTVLRVEKR